MRTNGPNARSNSSFVNPRQNSTNSKDADDQDNTRIAISSVCVCVSRIATSGLNMQNHFGLLDHVSELTSDIGHRIESRRRREFRPPDEGIKNKPSSLAYRRAAADFAGDLADCAADTTHDDDSGPTSSSSSPSPYIYNPFADIITITIIIVMIRRLVLQGRFAAAAAAAANKFDAQFRAALPSARPEPILDRQLRSPSSAEFQCRPISNKMVAG